MAIRHLPSIAWIGCMYVPMGLCASKDSYLCGNCMKQQTYCKYDTYYYSMRYRLERHILWHTLTHAWAHRQRWSDSDTFSSATETCGGFCGYPPSRTSGRRHRHTNSLNLFQFLALGCLLSQSSIVIFTRTHSSFWSTSLFVVALRYHSHDC